MNITDVLNHADSADLTAAIIAAIEDDDEVFETICKSLPHNKLLSDRVLSFFEDSDLAEKIKETENERRAESEL